jgi:hypothetical protein
MRLVLAAAVLLPALALAQGDGQVALLSRLHQEAATRSQLGDVVRLKGSAKGVTTFASTFANDWRVIDQAVLEYARDNGLALVPVQSDGQIERLKTLHGATLDHRFLAYVSLSSQALADQVAAERGQGDASFKRVVNRSLATLREHRREADRLLREVPST